MCVTFTTDEYYESFEEYQYYLEQRHAFDKNVTLKKAIKFRDDNRCVLCGRSEIELVVHHLNALRLYPELALCKENLVTLCQECHHDIHARFRLYEITSENFEILQLLKCGVQPDELPNGGFIIDKRKFIEYEPEPEPEPEPTYLLGAKKNKQKKKESNVNLKDKKYNKTCTRCRKVKTSDSFTFDEMKCKRSDVCKECEKKYNVKL